MVFNKSNIRQMIAGLIAVVMIGYVLTGKLPHKDAAALTDPVPAAAINDASVEGHKPVVPGDNDEILKKMTEQMANVRQQQRRIKDLKMQREETDLEVEEQKALSELNKIKKDNIGPVNDANSLNGPNTDVKIVYLGGTDTQKEAILSIHGTNYSVKDKDRPLKNMEVLSITNNDVTIHFLTPVDEKITYQFKSE